MTPADEADDEFFELYDPEIGRVDLVDKAANGLPFLIAKAGGTGLMPAAAVRRLIRETETRVAKSKASSAAMIVAYNAAGQAIGIVDPDDLQPITDGNDQDNNPSTAAAPAPPPDKAKLGPGADDTLQPQPAAEAGVTKAVLGQADVLRNRLVDARTVAEREQLAGDLNALGAAALAALQQTRAIDMARAPWLPKPRS